MAIASSHSEVTSPLPEVLETIAPEIKKFRDMLPGFLEQNLIGKWALLKGEVLIYPIDTQNDAINTGYSEFGNVPFLVAEILPHEIPAIFTTPPKPII